MMTRTARPILLAAALLASTALSALAGEADDQIKAPVLRATVNVTGEIVRVGDLIENAGVAANVAVYRAPDLGTTGVLPAAQVIATLRSHQVIGVDVRDIKEVAVTRLARAIDAKEISGAVAQALEHRNGLGEAAALSINFDQPVQDLKFEASSNGSLAPTNVRFDPRSGRFDIVFELGTAGSTKLRYTGTAIETVEAVVLTRNIDRNEVIRAGDLQTERRPKVELGGAEPASRELAVGMQMRRPVRAGQALKATDLAKPDLVQRDQTVTLIYQTAGIYLTTRGKALESGTEGDVVSVLNLQSKRTITGRVIGRGQVSIDIAVAKPAQTSEADAAPVAVASRLSSSATPKAE
ncbi:putative flagellar protein FlgA [Bradyrhizobium sp. ORS 278]|uniref:flagellar basal body P-ring formation chaperone FlgA n=1 Tax=Bradyrhizobium sp. (strain ORS 278) TaxID=114615 RepID=UPI0001508079|nr:flagellar basal body P-ring formation chaperone FlgA [Bradyrhizobium sp. ORS 278]CAL78736.1 putative flagellar protein FlgA [Bradyrhizobium sp. ORS 278]